MRAVDLIAKKRDGGELDATEIRFLIDGYTSGTIPDYQMSAWAMAVYFRGMSARETTDLTLAMVDSGERCDLSAIAGVKVDKHSTGGVADTTTLVVAPLVAAAGVPVAKMSGRGLGHTGGTIDKLESFSGFRSDLDVSDFLARVSRTGMAIIGQSANLTPADRLLYGLRDVTATVHSIPLIASSIMSKKLAAGADALLLDVKVGDGAFMKDLTDATRLAEMMVQIGTLAGIRTEAMLSNMDEPLGRAIGNALEVKEAIEVLRGRARGALRELSLAAATKMLMLANVHKEVHEARAVVEQLLDSGAALQMFKTFVGSQGGSELDVEYPERLPQAMKQLEICAPSAGYVQRVTASPLGHASMLLGAGRAEKSSRIDLAAGLVLQKKAGDYVTDGEPLCILHYNHVADEDLAQASSFVLAAYQLAMQPPPRTPLIYGWVSEHGIQTEFS